MRYPSLIPVGHKSPKLIETCPLLPTNFISEYYNTRKLAQLFVTHTAIELPTGVLWWLVVRGGVELTNTKEVTNRRTKKAVTTSVQAAFT